MNDPVLLLESSDSSFDASTENTFCDKMHEGRRPLEAGQFVKSFDTMAPYGFFLKPTQRRGQRTRALLVLAGLLGCVACSQTNEAELQASVEKQLQEARVEEASFAVKAFLQRSPESSRGRLLLGRVLVAMGDGAGGETELRRALSAGEPLAGVAADLARALLLQGKPQAVVEFAGTALLAAAATPDLGMQLAEAQQRMGNVPDALDTLAGLARRFPDSAEVAATQIRFKALQAGTPVSMAEVEGVVARHPDHRATLWLLADAKRAMGSPEAVGAYERAITADPRQAGPYSALIQLHAGAGRLDEARRVLSRLQQVAPSNASTLYCAALIDHLDGKSEAARQKIQPLLQLRPAQPAVLFLAGLIERRLGTVAQAETLLAQAVAAMPDNELPRRELARLQLALGKPAEVLSTLKPSLAHDSTDALVWITAAQAEALLGNAKGAASAIARAEKLKPSDAQTRVAFGRALLAQGRADAGLGQLRAAFDSASGPETDLALVLALMARGDPKAGEALDSLTKRYPGVPLIEVLRGQLEESRSDWASARAAYQRALDANPSFATALERLAALDLRDGQPARAFERYAAVAAKDPRASSAMLGAAHFGRLANRPWAESVEWLDKAVAAAPADPNVWLAAIEAHQRRGDIDGALTRAQRAQAALPNEAGIAIGLARAHVASGNGVQALAAVQQAVSAQPRSVAARLEMVRLLSLQKRYATARTHMEEALRLDAASDGVAASQVRLLLDEGRPTEALAYAAARLKAQPRNASAIQLMADAQAATERWKDAVITLRTGLAASPTTALAIRLSAALRRLPSVAEAERFEREWMSTHPADAEFVGRLAVAARARGETDRAVALYRRSLEIEPDAPVMLNNLAQLLLPTAPDEALRLARKATSAQPDAAPLLDTLAQALQATGDTRGAVTAQSMAVELAPREGDFRLSLGRLLIKAGERKKAREELERLASSEPDHPRMAEVRKLLAEIGG